MPVDLVRSIQSPSSARGRTTVRPDKAGNNPVHLKAENPLRPAAVFEPFGDELRVAVNIDLAQAAIPRVREFVRLIWLRDMDLAGGGFERRIINGERRLPFLEDEHFRVGVPMELRAAAGCAIEEDD